MKKVCIVIPVFKENPNKFEEVSLIQCQKVLGEFDIIFICPEQLDTTNYNSLIPGRKEFYFDPIYFKSVKSYSSLCKKSFFYKRFLEYEFMLVYQTDCFVFKNELLEWCNKGYDFIGPPWIHKEWMEGMARNLKMPFLKGYFNEVGNGGFSLRKVKKFFIFSRLYFLLADNTNFNEDVFWVNFTRILFPRFKISKFKDALAFGFEEEPEKCYALNNYTLPFGCHAWEKHDFDFWKVRFKEYGYDL